MRDLGRIHRPITGLVTPPRTPEEWEPFVLSEDQVAAFERDGFLRGVPVLSPDHVGALTRELDEISRPGHDGVQLFYEYNLNESKEPRQVLFHALGAWRVRPAFHDVLWNPAFLMAAFQLLGTGVRLFHDQVFAKPARHGGVVAWHQDYSYWTWTRPMAHLTCWMALDAACESNGCMYYVPGSHRWGLLDRPDLGGDMDAISSNLSPRQLEEFERRIPVELERGHASFHHPLLLHGSHENPSQRPRRATLVNVMADGVRSNMTAETMPGTNDFPTVPAGRRMDGVLYPLLLDPNGSLAPFLESVPKVRTTHV